MYRCIGSALASQRENWLIKPDHTQVSGGEMMHLKQSFSWKYVLYYLSYLIQRS